MQGRCRHQAPPCRYSSVPRDSRALLHPALRTVDLARHHRPCRVLPQPRTGGAEGIGGDIGPPGLRAGAPERAGVRPAGAGIGRVCEKLRLLGHGLADLHGARHGGRDDPGPGLSAGEVELHQLELRGRAVAAAERLVEGRGRLRGQAGLEVGPVLEAEAVQAAVPRLEEGHDRRQIVGAADAIGHVIAAARVGPAGVALLGARGQFDNLGAAFGAAACPAAYVVRKADLVKRHHIPLRPSDTARAMSLATCVRDCRKLSASRALIVTLTVEAPAWP